MSERLSDWLNICTDGQPTLPGWYDVKYSTDEEAYYKRRWFDGKRWKLEPDANECMFGNIKSDHRNEFWRGLAEAASNENSQRGSEA